MLLVTHMQISARRQVDLNKRRQRPHRACVADTIIRLVFTARVWVFLIYSFTPFIGIISFRCGRVEFVPASCCALRFCWETCFIYFNLSWCRGGLGPLSKDDGESLVEYATLELTQKPNCHKLHAFDYWSPDGVSPSSVFRDVVSLFMWIYKLTFSQDITMNDSSTSVWQLILLLEVSAFMVLRTSCCDPVILGAHWWLC